MDLGGTKIQAVVVDENDNVVGDAREPTPTSGGPRDVVAAIASALREAAARADEDPSALVGVGVGSPGAVDAAQRFDVTARGRLAIGHNSQHFKSRA